MLRRHGPGDGSDPEDLSLCIHCGHATYAPVAACPACGQPVQSRRWARRYGAILVVLGLFIAGLMGTVIWHVQPMLLSPGTSFGGTRFSGSARDAVWITAVLWAVFALGLATIVYGAWQARTGRRHRRAVAVAGVLLGLLYWFAAPD